MASSVDVTLRREVEPVPKSFKAAFEEVGGHRSASKSFRFAHLFRLSWR